MRWCGRIGEKAGIFTRRLRLSEAAVFQNIHRFAAGVHACHNLPPRLFQFGGDAFWLIENGRLTHMVRDVIYHGITPEFWGRCDGVADRNHRGRYGFITCGKGQPGQSGWMTHAASHARFRRVDVISGETKANA